ncbi:MAG: DUF2029 domain-containing protein [Crocinitomicaceae bacterium]|nr:DUF2029 domain-containing protein [Crocinitomicaceae bacterium]
MSEIIRNKILTLTGFLLVAFATLYISFEVPRENFAALIGLYGLGFAGLLISYQFAQTKDLLFLLIGGFLVRFLMINVTPELSQDFYRFIWDGEMMKLGMLPYVKTPDEIISSSPEIFQNAEFRALYHGMGELSSSNYSNYPPLNELLFLIASKLGTTLSSKIMILRIFIILSDLVIVLVGLNLLKMKELPMKKMLLFAINPFIILEFTGNLHFEGVMMCFFLVGTWLYLKDMKLLASFFLAFSILLKVFTLILLPFFIRKKEWKSGLTFIGMTLLFTLVFAYPFFMNSGLEGYQKANALYFQQFEFNAGIYYLIREIGWMFTGFNPIAYVGPVLAFVSLILILIWYFRNWEAPILKGFEVWTIAFLIFLSLSTTIHPWYIGVLLILSLFTNYWFPLVWSFMAFLSYYFYSEDMNAGMYYTLVGIETACVLGLGIYEIKAKLLKDSNV